MDLRGYYDSVLGMWIRVSMSRLAEPRAALFLDRDGVIVEETDYLCRAADTRLIPGAAQVIAAANAVSIPVIELTNQAGIGRGYYGWNDFLEVEGEIARQLALEGAHIDATYACPFHSTGKDPYRHEAHPARKPQPGMLLEAGRGLNLDLARSWIVGDHASDMLAGANAGLTGGIHVLTGHGAEERAKVLARDTFKLELADSILDVHPLLASLTVIGV